MANQHLDQDEFDAPTREPVPPEGDEATLALLQPGQRLARGVSRYLRSMGFASVEEFVPARGLRVDVMALGPKGELWVIECKSSRADFQSDCKWQGYLEWCDRYFWAVDVDFPTDLLPEGTGLILADAYDGEVVRMAPEQKLPPARRKKMIQKFAMDAARRLQRLRDPKPGRDGLLLSPSEGE
ncbi:MmcB family DNA repair protein [Tritonibacter mobilis]|uniref:MmcB family DNA repair protein n=1 Tax=Tritonibacter mobilis TaxID=379347 RepID=UPI001D0D9517|nr:MmcB family DNA repair protein [Tritonibacter mobilis]